MRVGMKGLAMVHAYHVVLPAYGFWLPNDPRGSWSEFVGRWELLRFGRATKALPRRALEELSFFSSELKILGAYRASPYRAEANKAVPGA